MRLAFAAEDAVDYGLVESVAVAKPDKLKVVGSVLSANINDILSPIGYGYERNLGVYFSRGPVFETGTKAVIGTEIEELFGGGASAGRCPWRAPSSLSALPSPGR